MYKPQHELPLLLDIRSIHIKIIFQSIPYHLIFCSVNSFLKKHLFKEKKIPVNHGHDRLMASIAKMIYLPAISNKASYANSLFSKYEETSN